MSLSSLYRRVRQRVLLRGVHFADRHARLDRLYRVQDPWQLDCARERFRFDATNAIILREFGRVGTLLEVGCGEGLQSAALSHVCATLRGIDISPIAIGRAQARCPNARFESGDITSGTLDPFTQRADLAVACEVLYYVKDVKLFLACLSKSAKTCLVTIHAIHEKRLEADLARYAPAGQELIQHGDTQWIAVWWRN